MRKKEPVFYGKRRKGRIALAVLILAFLYSLILSGEAKWNFAATVLLIPAFGFLVWSLRRPRLNTSSKGRHGLLNSETRPPLSLSERKGFVVHMAETGNDYTNLQNLGGIPRTLSDFRALETIRLLGLWQKPGQPLSDDEVRSLYLLRRVSFTGEDGNLTPIHSEDAKAIADWEAVNAFRDRIQASINARNEKSADYQAWLANVGNPDAFHLVEDGWIPFLETFDTPDIKLWHNIATYFHNLHGDHLNAAFWILDQPDCDKATAYSFIAGYIGYGFLKSVMEDAQRQGNSATEAVQPFVSVISRWNNGFYERHSIAFDEDETPNEHIEDGVRLNDQLQALSNEFEIALPLVENLEFDPTNPTNGLSHSKPSGFDIFDGEGLHLKYPNRWPEGYGPRPTT